jgi:hypothetical protein
MYVVNYSMYAHAAATATCAEQALEKVMAHPVLTSLCF